MASARSVSNPSNSPSTYSLQDSDSRTSIPVAWARPVARTSDSSPASIPLPPSPLASPRLQPAALPPLQHKPSGTLLSRGPFASFSRQRPLTSTGDSRTRPTASPRSTSDSSGSAVSSLGTLSSAFPQPPPPSSPSRYFLSSYAKAHTAPDRDPIARARRAQEARRKGQRTREQLYKDRTTPRKLKKKGRTARGSEPRGLKRSLSKGFVNFDKLSRRKQKVQVTTISSPFAGDELQKEELVKAFYRNGGRLEEEEMAPGPGAPSNTPATIHIRRLSPLPAPSPPPPLHRKRAKDYTPIRLVHFAPKLSSQSARKVTNRGRPLPKRRSPGSGPLATPRPRHNLLRSFAALAVEDDSAEDEKEGWIDDDGEEDDMETPLPEGRLVWNSDEEDWSPPSPTVEVYRRASVAREVDENTSSPTPGRWLSSFKLGDSNSPLRGPLAPSSHSNALENPFDDLDPCYTESVWPTGADGLPLIWSSEEPNVVATAEVVGTGTPALAHRTSLSDIKSPVPFTPLTASTSSRSRPLPPTPGPPVHHEWSRVASYRTTSHGSSQAVSLSASHSPSSHVSQEGLQIATDQRSLHDEESQLGSPTTRPASLHSTPPTRTTSPLRLTRSKAPCPISPPPASPTAPYPSTPRLHADFGTALDSPITLSGLRGPLKSPSGSTVAQFGDSSLPSSPLANRRSRPTPPQLFIPPRSLPKYTIERESPVDHSFSPSSPIRSTRPLFAEPKLGDASSSPVPDAPSVNPSTDAPSFSLITTPHPRIRRASSSLSLLNRSNSLSGLIPRHTKSVASFHPSLPAPTTAIVEATPAPVALEREEDASTPTTMKGTPSVARTSIVAEGAFVESPKVESGRGARKTTSMFGSMTWRKREI